MGKTALTPPSPPPSTKPPPIVTNSMAKKIAMAVIAPHMLRVSKALFTLFSSPLLLEIDTINANPRKSNIPNNKVINVKWLYEEGDDEMQESGEIYEDLLPRFNFSYKQYTET